MRSWPGARRCTRRTAPSATKAGAAWADSRTCATTPMMQNAELFKAIVIDGALTDNGMLSFSKVLSAEDAEAIRAHLVTLANDLKANPQRGFGGFGPPGGGTARAGRGPCSATGRAAGGRVAPVARRFASLPIHSFFPTRIHAATLPRGRAAILNAQLLRECRQLRARGRWPGAAGRAAIIRVDITSYASAHHMHRHVADVRAAGALDRWPGGAVRARAGIRSGWAAAAVDDGLLGQRHAARRDAQPAPASTVGDQRHLLRARARAARRA